MLDPTQVVARATGHRPAATALPYDSTAAGTVGAPPGPAGLGGHRPLRTAADLRGAVLDEADLTGADFRGAKLEGASLAGAVLG